MSEILTVDQARNIIDSEETVEQINLTSASIEVSEDTDFLSVHNLPLTKESQISLCKLLRVPGNFYVKCKDTVRSAILKQAIESANFPVQVVFSRGSVVDVLGEHAVYHPITKVFDRVVTTLQEHSYPLKGVLNPEINGHSRLSFVTERAQNPVNRVGDSTHSGISVVWSRYGNPRLGIDIKVQSFLHRLICTNGLTTPDYFGFPVHKTNGDFYRRLDETLLKSLAFSETLLSKFVDSDTKKVENPAHFLAHMVEDSGYGKRALPHLITLLSTLPEQATAYDIINLVTAYANDQKPRLANSLQTLGGVLTESVFQNRCRTCNRCIN